MDNNQGSKDRKKEIINSVKSQIGNPFIRTSPEPAPGLWHTVSMDLAEVFSCLLHLVEPSLLLLPPAQQHQHAVPNTYLWVAPLYQKHPSALAETWRMALGTIICEQASQKIFWLFALDKPNIFKKVLMQTAWGQKRASIWSWKLIILVQKLKGLIIDFFKT